MRCAASLALESNYPDTSSAYADEGSAAHALAAMALTAGLDALGYIGCTLTGGTREFTVTDEMVINVQAYLDYVRGLDGDLYIEQRSNFSRVIGVPDSFGTADAVVASDEELIITDLKYGQGVRVDVEDNEQLLLYALGIVEEFGLAYAFQRIRLVICQPRLDNLCEWTVTLAQLEEFAAQVTEAAMKAIAVKGMQPEVWGSYATPGDKQCRFCRAKSDCPAVAALVSEGITGRTDQLIPPAILSATRDLEEVYSQALGQRMDAVDLIESWCKAVRARVESELIRGRSVAGYKLVQGRQGARQWSDRDEAERELKAMRLKQEVMYDLSLISPTTAEKLAKAGTIGPRQYERLKQLVTRAEGKLSVAPSGDKRPHTPAVVFTDLTKEFDA